MAAAKRQPRERGQLARLLQLLIEEYDLDEHALAGRAEVSRSTLRGWVDGSDPHGPAPLHRLERNLQRRSPPIHLPLVAAWRTDKGRGSRETAGYSESYVALHRALEGVPGGRDGGSTSERYKEVLQAAQRDLDRGQPDAVGNALLAAKVHDQVMKTDPSARHLRRPRAQLLGDAGRWDQALVEFEALIREDRQAGRPPNAGDVFQAGIQSLSKGDFDYAEDATRAVQSALTGGDSFALPPDGFSRALQWAQAEEIRIWMLDYQEGGDAVGRSRKLLAWIDDTKGLRHPSRGWTFEARDREGSRAYRPAVLHRLGRALIAEAAALPRGAPQNAKLREGLNRLQEGKHEAERAAKQGSGREPNVFFDLWLYRGARLLGDPGVMDPEVVWDRLEERRQELEHEPGTPLAHLRLVESLRAEDRSRQDDAKESRKLADAGELAEESLRINVEAGYAKGVFDDALRLGSLRLRAGEPDVWSTAALLKLARDLGERMRLRDAHRAEGEFARAVEQLADRQGSAVTAVAQGLTEEVAGRYGDLVPDKARDRPWQVVRH